MWSVVTQFAPKFNPRGLTLSPVVPRALADASPSASLGRGSLEELVHLTGSAAALQALAPDLRVEGAPTPEPLASEPDRDEHGALEALGRDGIATLATAVAPATQRALHAAIEQLAARDLPATFVYLFDDAWRLAEDLRARVSRAFGREYRLVEDVWAWRIAPGEGRGWTAHRGIAHERLDRAAPEILNLWVALSDVEANRACMHAIPLGDDPAYPGALDAIDAPPGAVRVLPLAAGDALVWNANVLHWGGVCAPDATGPRLSCSFTLCRADAAARFGDLVMLRPLAELDLGRRALAVARMVELYGGVGRADVRDAVRAWAALTRALASRFGS